MTSNSQGEPAAPGFARAAWTLVLLCAAYLLAFVDRTIINLLVDPISTDLGISDTQFGALQGLAFGVFYTLAAFPLGRLADMFNRRTLLSAGLAVFTFFSIASGLARTFTAMFLSRMGVGLGEANLLPTAYSLLSDTFRPEKLGLAISVFTTGAFLGVGLSYIWGGQLIGWFTAAGNIELPVVGLLKPWQQTMIVLALPGLLLAPLLLTLKEPHQAGSGSARRKAVLPLRQVLGEFARRRRVLIPLFSAFAIIALSGHASAVWTIAVFLRSYEMPPAQIGPIYGMTYMAAAIPGALLGGWICDRLTAKNVLDAPVKVAAIGFLGTGIFGGLAPLMPDPMLAIMVFAPGIALQSAMFPLAGTAIQLMLPSHLRGQFSALYLVVINVIGLGLGPVLIGLLTDQVFAEPADVRYAIALVNAGCAPVGVVLLCLALGPYRAERARNAAMTH